MICTPTARSSKHGRGLARARLGAVAMAAILAGPASAQQPVLVPSASSGVEAPAPDILRVPTNARTQRFTMPVGKSIIVDLPEDATEVFVGKPEVANAVVRTPRRLYVMALAKGPTTIFALDRAGRAIATLSINVNDRDIGALSGILKTVMPDNDIRVQAIDDSIILTGTVASAVDAQRALDIASAYTGYTAVGTGASAGGGGGGGVAVAAGTPVVVPGHIINSLVIRGQDQVMLKVSIVEIRRDIVKQLGVNISGAWSGAVLTTPQGVVANTVAAQGDSGVVANLYNGRNTLSATLSAFEKNGVAHVLAEPTVTAISGESAKFLAGGTIPIAQGVTQGSNNSAVVCTYIQQQYGVTLNFVPIVLSGGRISLHVSTQVVEPDSSVSINIPPCGVQPGFRTRQERDDGRATIRWFNCLGWFGAAVFRQYNQRHAGCDEPADPRCPVQVATVSAPGNRADDRRHALPRQDAEARSGQQPRRRVHRRDRSTIMLLGRVNKIYSTAGNPDLVRSYRGRVGFIND